MTHYDYVMLPNGFKKKIFSYEDILSVLNDWEGYIENNWISPQNKMFDPESKVKYMLEGLANIILRPNMKGLLTEYQKMKIGKYEIPISSFVSAFNDELYSRRTNIDNGEEEAKIKEMMDELAKKYDDALASRTKRIPSKKKKTFPPTRRQKIEKARKEYGVKSFTFVRVDTCNEFEFKNKYYVIPDYVEAYAAKETKDGDMIYDMDQILCAETEDNNVIFFDMNIEPVEGIVLKAEQINFLKEK